MLGLRLHHLDCNRNMRNGSEKASNLALALFFPASVLFNSFSAEDEQAVVSTKRFRLGGTAENCWF